MAKSKLTTCKACGAEVAKNAKTCPHCGAKLNTLPAIAIVAIVVIIFIMVFLIVAILAGGDGESSDPSTTPATTSEVVVLDDDVVKVTYKDVTSAVGIEGCYLGLNVENKTDSEIWVHLDKASINDEMIPLVMSGVPMNIQPNKSSNNPFILPFANLSITSVEEIETIQFKVIVDNNETGNNIETSDMLTINVK